MAMVLRSPSSSSASMMYSCFSYDVFLSFRGADARKTFTDHLYTALKQAGIRTFRDDDAMERGRLLKPELEKAIKQSQVSLIVFSKSYATSKWCLDEVLMIMKEYDDQRREVVPVFYNIDPTDVRHQTGCFEDAFKGYDDEVTRETDVEKKMELSDKVKAWRASLRKAGSLTGMVLDGYEAKFITSVVKVIQKKLNYNALYIDEKLVGITENIAKIELWLQDPLHNAVLFVIVGMGGIGKTTIAKCIYNLNFQEYDGSCFLANINEASSQPSGMLRLQSQLLSTILKSEKEETVWNEYEGTSKITGAICNKKVLLVLDDVTTSEQLYALLGQHRFFPGSKVIITTRNARLSTAFTVPHEVQTIKTLSYRDSMKLFCLYAFQQDQPNEAYVDESKQAIHYCERLPLALKVLGSNLRGKSIVEWKDAMCKLEKNPLHGIQNVLQLSYESLDDKDKDLFLHIACFFVGEDEDWVVKLLDGCNLYPIIGIKNLKDSCLLYVVNGKVGMHQLIRKMGQEVVCQESPKDPGNRSRLWNHEDCLNVLRANVGTEKVEGLMLDMQKIREAKSTSAITMVTPRKRSFLEYLGEMVYGKEANFNIGALENMKNLMLLQLNYATVSGKYKKLPKKLRLLRWHGFSLKCIPCDTPLEKLVVLDMSYSKLKCVWVGSKIIKSLKILNLSYSDKLIETPDFRGLPRLESLILKGCKSLTKVHESIAYLNELVLLDLTDCRSLRNVPCVPRSLVSLDMSGCPNLGAVGGFQCSGSISLPSLLVRLNISKCNLFDNSFPNDWSNLVSLEELTIDGNNVTYLPKCIQSLPTLTHLYVKRCSQIQSILGLPKTLLRLNTSKNRSLEKVHAPPGSGINAYGCPKLDDVVGLYKRQSVDKVERKVIQNLGLGMELGVDNKQKVFFKHGIFSTLVTEEEQIPPSSFFTYKERGPQISFIVPPSPHHPNRIISGFSLCLVFSPNTYCGCNDFIIKVYNKTKDLKWFYHTEYMHYERKEGGWKERGWLSVWRCGNLLQHGDEIFVRILEFEDEDEYEEKEGVRVRDFPYGGVEECCVKLIYEEDNIEEQDGERKEECNNDKVAMSEYDDDNETIIRWSDRMDTNISEYVHPGMTYSFEYQSYVFKDGHFGWFETRSVDGEKRGEVGQVAAYPRLWARRRPMNEKPVNVHPPT